MSVRLERADGVMGRLLFIRERQAPMSADLVASRKRQAENALTLSLLFSGARCVMQYALLPFLLPIIGIAAEATIPILLFINVIAMVSIFFSLRRFWDDRLQASLDLSGCGLRGADTADRVHGL